MNMMLAFLCFTFVYFANCQDFVTVTTNLGQVKGNKVVSNSQTIYEFLGLRYSIPLLNNLRFRQAQEYTTPYDDVYDATQYPCGCPQYNYDGTVPCYSEDCLFLNIFTTSIPENVNDTNELVPVLFYVHGGSFIGGSCSQSRFHGESMLAENDIPFVLVTINYRLGPLGFFASDQLVDEDPSFPSNGGLNGLYDQLIAYQWTKNNIIYYGGDPSKITIFGESAGGLSLSNLILSPLSSGMFTNVIIESGPSNGPWEPIPSDAGIVAINNVLDEYQIPNNITYLRTLDAQDLIKLEGPMETAGWLTIVDGYVLNDLPSVLFGTPDYEINAKNIIWGINSQDGLSGWPYFDGNSPQTDKEFYDDLQAYTDDDTIVNDIYYTYYPMSDYKNASIAWYKIGSDTCIACPTLSVLNDIATHNQQINLYLYYFESSNENKLAPHAGELPYVFYKPDDAAYYSETWNDTLSHIIMENWINFAYEDKPKDVNWQLYTEEISPAMVFNNDYGLVTNFSMNLRHNVCNELWNREDLFVLSTFFCFNSKTPAS